MRVLVAPQEFKGSLTAAEAASAITRGVRRSAPASDVDTTPLSDGGPGFVDALLSARAGRRRHAVVRDALMRPVEAAWGLLDDGTAIIEMAAASGLTLTAPEERRPLEATTYGAGELIRAALEERCGEIIVGVGGSATTDAGAGAMQALGARLPDQNGNDLETGGGALARLDRIDLSQVDQRLRDTRVRVATDVRNPLHGREGAAMVFAPQKGASPDEVLVLDRALQRFADVVRRDYGIDFQEIPGAGAAGGLPAGLMLIAGATIEPGFDVVADAVGLAERIANADLVVTGEGRLDEQSAYGKTSVRVATFARAAHVPVVAVCGSVAEDVSAHQWFDVVVESTPRGMPVDEAMARAAELVAQAAARATSAFLR